MICYSGGMDETVRQQVKVILLEYGVEMVRYCARPLEMGHPRVNDYLDRIDAVIDAAKERA